MPKVRRDPAVTHIETSRFELVKFTVEGRGEFPVDMLRYDRCWPAAETDASAVRLANANRDPNLVTRVTLTSIGYTAPTRGRWASFGWQIVQSNQSN